MIAPERRVTKVRLSGASPRRASAAHHHGAPERRDTKASVGVRSRCLPGDNIYHGKVS